MIPRAPGLSFTTAGYAEPGPARTFRLSPAGIFTIRKVEVVVGVEVGVGATGAGCGCVCGIGAMLDELLGASSGAAFGVTATARRAELSSGVAEAHGFAGKFFAGEKVDFPASRGLWSTAGVRTGEASTAAPEPLAAV